MENLIYFVKKQLDEENECTFKPKINHKSSKIRQMSPNQRNGDKTLFDKLYEESHFRAESQIKYEKMRK